MADIDISDVLRRARKNCSGTSKASTEGRAVLAHIERQAAEIERLRVADARYAYLRTITPGQLAQLQKIAREGELTFDQVVDEARAWRG